MVSSFRLGTDRNMDFFCKYGKSVECQLLVTTALATPNAFIITNKGEVKTAPVNSDNDRHYVRGFRDPDAVNTIH